MSDGESSVPQHVSIDKEAAAASSEKNRPQWFQSLGTGIAGEIKEIGTIRKDVLFIAFVALLGVIFLVCTLLRIF